MAAAETEVKSIDPVVDSKPAAFKNSNSNSNQRRLIKCYCNDEFQCPRQTSSTTSTKPSSLNNRRQNPPASSSWLSSDEKLAVLLERNHMSDTAPRYCQTSTMCVTKRLQKYSGETWLKYGCDMSQPDSIKSNVIDFRDCRVHTSNEHDRQFVLANSAEFCCNADDYCNVELAPIQWSKDLPDYAQNAAGNNNGGGGSGGQQDLNSSGGGGSSSSPSSSSSSTLAPINLVLGCLSFAVFILVIVLFVLYLYKKVDFLNLNFLDKKKCFEK